MAETKYGKYLIREPIIERDFAPGIRLAGEKVGGANFSISWSCYSEPFVLRNDPHSHDFDQFLVFHGGNPMNVREFGAEIELSLGDEGEKHIIDTTTVVYIPKGLMHCPLNFKRVDKPVVHMDILLSPQYATAKSE